MSMSHRWAQSRRLDLTSHLRSIAGTIVEHEEAEKIFLANALGEKTAFFVCLVGLAEVAVDRGEMARAARLLGVADALREEIGYSPEPGEREQRERVATALGDDAMLIAARSEGRALTLDEAIELALLPIDSPKTPDEQAPTR